MMETIILILFGGAVLICTFCLGFVLGSVTTTRNYEKYILNGEQDD